MKKDICILILLLVLSGGTLTAGHLWVNSARERLDITETVLAGDPAAAAGLSVTCRIQDRENHIFWTTSFAPGGAERAETAFRFSGPGEAEEYIWADNVSLSCASGNFGMTGTRLLDREIDGDMLILPLLDLASRTPAGEERTETIRLADYYDYYPMIFSANGGCWTFDSVYSTTNGWLDRYFRLEVETDTMCEITVRKDGADNVVSVDMNMDQSGGYLFCDGVVTQYGIFLIAASLDAESQPDGRLQCPDGPGIHFIPFQDDEGLKPAEWLDLSGLRLFYPTGNARVLRLTASSDGEDLLLYTEEGGTLVLTVLDPATGELRQRLDLLESDVGNDMTLVEAGELHLALSGQLDRFSLVSKEMGRYVRVLAGRFGVLDGTQYMLTDPTMSPALAWDGERMVLAAMFPYCYWRGQENHNTAVGVWDAEGLRYLGTYDFGLSRDPSTWPGIDQYKGSQSPLSLELARK